MAGEIKHQWNGSVLTVISDSGASSADLKGPKGDTGPRGPQGPAGVVYNEEGEVVVDLSIFYTATEVDDMFEQNTPDLSSYATKTELTEAVANVEVDLSDYATEEYVEQRIVDIASGGEVSLDNYYTKTEIDETLENQHIHDGRTLVIDGNGNLKTAIGGYWDNGYIASATGINHVCESGREFAVLHGDDYINMAEADIEYNWRVKFSDGATETGTLTFEDYSPGVWLHADVSGTYVTCIGIINRGASDPMKGIHNGVYVDVSLYDGSLTIDEFYLWQDGVGEYVPMDGNYIPVDGITVVLNKEGQLAATGLSADASLTGFATTAYVDSKIKYSTTDLSAGLSKLDTGVLYVVYE